MFRWSFGPLVKQSLVLLVLGRECAVVPVIISFRSPTVDHTNTASPNMYYSSIVPSLLEYLAQKKFCQQKAGVPAQPTGSERGREE